MIIHYARNSSFKTRYATYKTSSTDNRKREHHIDLTKQTHLEPKRQQHPRRATTDNSRPTTRAPILTSNLCNLCLCEKYHIPKIQPPQFQFRTDMSMQSHREMFMRKILGPTLLAVIIDDNIRRPNLRLNVNQQ